jgi:hypothetical protein
MKSYLFLIGWFPNSEGALYKDTGVNTLEDLLPQCKQGNESILALRINTDLGESCAEMAGFSHAFRYDYTSHDTFSVLLDWDESYSDIKCDSVTI